MAKHPSKRRIGRPSSYSDKVASQICRQIAEGASLRSICRQKGSPSTSTVLRWLSGNTAFQTQYARAREAQADAWAEEIVELSDQARDLVMVDEKGRMRVDHGAVLRQFLQRSSHGRRVDPVARACDDDDHPMT